MSTKVTKNYLKCPSVNELEAHILYSDKYAITLYNVQKNGILTVVPDFKSLEDSHTTYIILRGSFIYNSGSEEVDLEKKDAIEIDNHTSYFFLESKDGGSVLAIENGTSTYVQNISEKIEEELKRNPDFDHKEVASSIDVIRLANLIVKYLPWTIDLDKLTKAALIRDIGKLEIDEKILNKPGKLTEQEFQIIKLHPEKSLKYMNGTFDDPVIREAVLEHHERLDGSGYPKGLKDTDISKEAKILMVADMYSALTNKRVYRHEKYTPEEAYEIIKNDCNKNKLDKDVVAALHKAIMDKEEN